MDAGILADEIADAMRDVQDMDTSLSDYARAAVKCFGWRRLATEKPDEGDTVIATDGQHRWMDKWMNAVPRMCWDGHTATHWHPLLDVPNGVDK
jgi:hypothetical protein